MTSRWHGAPAVVELPPGDFASDIVWRMRIPVAVLDHAGHLEFANGAFADAGLAGLVLDGQRFLIDQEIEQLRQEVLKQAHHRSFEVRAVYSEPAHSLVEVLELAQLPGWTAVVFQPQDQPGRSAAELPSAALILHELRSPMLGVRESLDRLTQDCARMAPELSGAVSRQSRAVTRLMSVLAGLGDLVKAGELAPKSRDGPKVSLVEVVGDVQETFDLLAAASGHELLVVQEGLVPAIRGDRALLTRAVANLVDNALKYSPPPGPVRVVVGARGALAVVEVWDTGLGIAPADRAVVFEPFVRLARGADLSSTGSGLGLAVVQTVVRAHGGSLSVESDPAAGSVFRLSFLISSEGP
ncbi:MAG: sensor histidine kinase [Candidatus Dormibacteria bacterium]